MKRSEQVEIKARVVIDNPVPGVLHSLQSGDDRVLSPQRSSAGEPLFFDFPLRVGPGPKFFGDQVRREGPQRRFVYIRIGQSAGDHGSPWTRRMKIDIHETEQKLIDEAVGSGRVIEYRISGTAVDGSPACATIRPIVRGLAP
ncbi:MAG: DUF5990 family protein [Sphingomicrobium sp.]